MDILDLKSDLEPIEFSPTHPETGEEMDIVFKLTNRHSFAYQSNMRKIADIIGKDNAETNEEIALSALVASFIVGWENIEVKGDEYQYNIENSLDLMNGWLWIRTQIDQEVSKHSENFLGKSKD